MDKFVALAFSGIAHGAILAIIAVGFILLYQATGVVNFAHGDLVTLGAYLGLWLVVDHHLPTIAGYLVALALMAGVGLVLERVAYAPLRRRPAITAVVATLAAAVAIRAALAVWQGAAPRQLPSPVGDEVFQVGGAAISQQRLVIIVVSAVIIGGLMVVLAKTSFGRSIRAAATDPEMVTLSGVNLKAVTMAVFALSVTLAGVAGILVAPLGSVDLNFGFGLLVTGFAAAVLGGFGSIGGAVLGALAMGLIEQLVGGYVLTDYSSILPFIVLFIVLAIRPQGLVATDRSRL